MTRGPNAKAPAVRGGDEGAGQAEVLGAEAHHRAGREAHAVDQDLLGDQTGQAVVRVEGRVEPAAAVERDPAVERVGGVDGLDLHQGAVGLRTGVRDREQRAKVDDFRDLRRVRIHPGALGGVGEAVGELDLGVAAKEGCGLPGEPVVDRRAHRADRGNGRDPEGEAGEEDAEAREPAAEFAQAEAEGRRQPHAVAGAQRRRCARAIPGIAMIDIGLMFVNAAARSGAAAAARRPLPPKGARRCAQVFWSGARVFARASSALQVSKPVWGLPERPAPGGRIIRRPRQGTRVRRLAGSGRGRSGRRGRARG